MISRYGPGTSDVISPLAGIKALLGDKAEVLHAEGVHFKDARFPASDQISEAPNAEEQKGIDEAVALAKQSDVIVVVVGENHETIGESLSRTSLDLPGHQTLLVQEMVKTGKPVVVVLMIGRAASINWIDQNVPGIMVCWHGGEKVGQAVAETLFGDNNPGGKLSLTFPQTAGQLPLCIPHRKGAWGAQNRSADENGWGATRAVDPIYYFGEGLSYTSFEYSNLKIVDGETITVSCDVSNVGKVDGDEVVQLYVTDVVASVAPFDQILRGFDRVSIKAGETKTVSFKLVPERDLKMLNRKNEWVVEPGKFEVKLGTSSAPKGIKLKGEFNIR